MTRVKPDNVVMASFIDTYINYDTISTNVLISGSVNNGASAIFTGELEYPRENTRADLYSRNKTTGVKRPISGGPRQSPYTFVSSEICTQGAIYGGNAILVSFVVTNNTGVTIVLTTQTLEITAVLYEVPN